MGQAIKARTSGRRLSLLVSIFNRPLGSERRELSKKILLPRTKKGTPRQIWMRRYRLLITLNSARHTARRTCQSDVAPVAACQTDSGAGETSMSYGAGLRCIRSAQ